jgi:crossover junction endonuclease MUS81
MALVFPTPYILMKGPIICKKLEDKLKVYCAAEGLPMPNKPGHTNTEPTDLPGPSQGAKRKAPSARQYIPKFRSGGWAILRALETFPQNASVTKAELVRVAHQFCDSSFETPLDNKFYTAWNSMKTLLEKGYVYKNGNPPRFCLTDEGLDIARTLIKASEGMSGESGGVTVVPGEPPAPKRSRPIDSQKSFVSPDTMDFLRKTPQIYNPPPISHFIPRGETRVLPAGSYTIQLIMDNREIHSQVDRDRLEREIGEGGIDYTIRALDVGDALWIAKSGTNEYVLDYIVERKRMDDLVSSITDGRFHEQKVFLLKKDLIIVSSNEIGNATYHLSH